MSADDTRAPGSAAWANYFDERLTLEIPIATSTNPLQQASSLILENPLSSTTPPAVDKFNVYIAGSIHKNILLCLHGAGQTALSWCLVAKRLKATLCVVAYDLRGHGLTECQDARNLSKARLVDDGLAIVQHIRQLIESRRKTQPPPAETDTLPKPEDDSTRAAPREKDEPALAVRKRILCQSRRDSPCIILTGHSMGGAIAIHMAATQRVPNLQGLIALDVVEGTAMEALPAMHKFVRCIPQEFPSVEMAVHWALKYVLSNRESAEISIPSQLRQEGNVWRWRVDLASTKPFWEDWFKQTSASFLKAATGTGGKVLVLVGHERLDKELTIGHMQGKYQLTVIPRSGHIIEEDQPDDVVHIILEFLERYMLCEP